MRPGSVLVDLAVENGGNVELSKYGEMVEHQGVKIVGHANVPSRLAPAAASLYARNLFNFVQLLIDKDSKELTVNLEDDLVKGTLTTKDGEVVHPALTASQAA
jgi:NAD(P) transhydrogenase subunit alpha